MGDFNHRSGQRDDIRVGSPSNSNERASTHTHTPCLTRRVSCGKEKKKRSCMLWCISNASFDYNGVKCKTLEGELVSAPQPAPGSLCSVPCGLYGVSRRRRDKQWGNTFLRVCASTRGQLFLLLLLWKKVRLGRNKYVFEESSGVM